MNRSEPNAPRQSGPVRTSLLAFDQWLIPLLVFIGILTYGLWPNPDQQTNHNAPNPIAQKLSAARPTFQSISAEVAKKNEHVRSERQHFRNQGWRSVSSTPPSAQLVSYDPDLVNSHLAELQTQMQSTTATESDLKNLRQIFFSSQDLRTKIIAIESIARVGTQNANLALIECFEATQDHFTRQTVLNLLQPFSSDDQSFGFLIRLAQDRNSQALSNLIAFALKEPNLTHRETTLQTIRQSLGRTEQIEFDRMLSRFTQPQPHKGHG